MRPSFSGIGICGVCILEFGILYEQLENEKNGEIPPDEEKFPYCLLRDRGQGQVKE